MRRNMAMVAVAALRFTLGVVQAEDKTPDATLALHGGSVAAGIGLSWGSDTLTYK